MSVGSWLLVQARAEVPVVVAFGALVALSQWPALRLLLPPVRWWTWFALTVVGWTAGVLFLPGLFVGMAQWQVLRRQVRFASIWIPANLAAWLVLPCGAVYDIVGVTVVDTLGWPVATAIAAGALGAIYGVITGLVLVSLPLRPSSEG